MLEESATTELEPSMNQVQVEDEIYEMPPREGFTVAHFLTVADVERSLRFTKRCSKVAF